MKETEKVGICGKLAASLWRPEEERWLLYDLTFSRLTHLRRIFFTTITDSPPISQARQSSHVAHTCEIPPRAQADQQCAHWERAVQR